MQPKTHKRLPLKTLIRVTKAKKKEKNHIPKHNYPEHCRHIRQISPNWCCHKNRIHHLLARARLPLSKASPKPRHHINVARFWADPPRSPKLHTRLPFGVQVVVFSWQDWVDGTPCRAVLIKQAIKKRWSFLQPFPRYFIFYFQLLRLQPPPPRRTIPPGRRRRWGSEKFPL